MNIARHIKHVLVSDSLTTFLQWKIFHYVEVSNNAFEGWEYWASGLVWISIFLVKIGFSKEGAMQERLRSFQSSIRSWPFLISTAWRVSASVVVSFFIQCCQLLFSHVIPIIICYCSLLFSSKTLLHFVSLFPHVLYIIL